MGNRNPSLGKHDLRIGSSRRNQPNKKTKNRKIVVHLLKPRQKRRRKRLKKGVEKKQKNETDPLKTILKLVKNQSSRRKLQKTGTNPVALPIATQALPLKSKKARGKTK